MINVSKRPTFSWTKISKLLKKEEKTRIVQYSQLNDAGTNTVSTTRVTLRLSFVAENSSLGREAQEKSRKKSRGIRNERVTTRPSP